MVTPKYIFVHHTAVSYEKNPNQWRATDSYHKKKGWGGGGYNYEISKAGTTHQFRDDGMPTAAQYQQGMNSGKAISICLDGNFDIEYPTVEQCRELHRLIVKKMETYGIHRSNVRPHRAVAAYKSCWGKLLPNDILSYLEARLELNSVPEWAKESVETAKTRGIDKWDNPWEEINPKMVEYILNDLGLRENMKGTISKVEFIHALFKAGVL